MIHDTKKVVQGAELSDVTAAVEMIRARIPSTRDTDFDGGIDYLFDELLIDQEQKGIKRKLKYRSNEPHLVALVNECIASSDPWGYAKRLAKEFAEQYNIIIEAIPQRI